MSSRTATSTNGSAVCTGWNWVPVRNWWRPRSPAASNIFPDRDCAERDCGYVLCDGRFRFHPDEPTRVRRPDTPFVGFERLGGREFPAGNVDAAPELAVGAVSTSDTFRALQRRITEHLRHGVLEVGVAQPAPRAIDVHRPTAA